MEYISKKQFLLVIIMGVLLAVFIVSFSIYRSGIFRIVGTIPAINRDIPSSTSSIQLKFNQTLDTADYSSHVTGKDAAVVRRVRTEGKTLWVDLNLLKDRQSYTFTINNIHSQKGKLISGQAITFRAVYTPFNKLSEEQRAQEIQETDRGNTEDPIIAYLPYQGDRFYLTAEYNNNEQGKAILVINAQLFLSRQDLGSGREAAIESLKQKVSKYIESKGLNPTSYTIRYIINEPPANPS
jgi:hypothetical protein